MTHLQMYLPYANNQSRAYSPTNSLIRLSKFWSINWVVLRSHEETESFNIKVYSIKDICSWEHWINHFLFSFWGLLRQVYACFTGYWKSSLPEHMSIYPRPFPRWLMMLCIFPWAYQCFGYLLFSIIFIKFLAYFSLGDRQI